MFGDKDRARLVSRCSIVIAWLSISPLACTSESISSPCVRDSECQSGICGLPTLGLEHSFDSLPLSCLPANQGNPPATACERGDTCKHGLCVLAGSCARPCMDDADCGEGEQCSEAFVRLAEDATRAQVCLRQVQLPADVTVESAILKDALSGSVDTETISLSGTLTPTVYVVEHLGDSIWPFSMNCRPPLCPQSLRTRASAPVVLYNRDAEPTIQGVSIADWPYAFPMTVYVGNNIDPTYTTRGYELDVVSEVPGDVRITKLSRKPDGHSILDLNLFYAGASGLQPTGTRGPPPIATALETVSEIFSQVGITLGQMHQYAIPEALLVRGNTFTSTDDPRAGFSVLKRGYGVWPELPALFALSAGAPHAAVNLFLVADIDGMGSGEVQALSGGTPGPMGMHGTGASGIALATDMLLTNPERLGRTMAHEICHYLGLFHPSEVDGNTLEPLADTPVCSTEQDSNGDGQLSVEECADHGADNLLFWAESTGTTLTEQQGIILRRAVILR